MSRACACCGEPFVNGYSLSLAVYTVGRLPRYQKRQAALEICSACAKRPGSRLARPVLRQALVDAVRLAVAQIENMREVRALGSSSTILRS